MSQPKTLLQMAGADLTPNALSESALILIHCLMEYVSGAVPPGGVAAALDEAERVLCLFDTADAADLIKSGSVQIPINRNGKEQVAD